MIWGLRKLLRKVSREAKVTPAPTPNVFRHTYATARLQTTDGGKEFSVWQVAKEMGHRSVARVEDTYGHPSNHRSVGDWWSTGFRTRSRRAPRERLPCQPAPGPPTLADLA